MHGSEHRESISYKMIKCFVWLCDQECSKLSIPFHISLPEGRKMLNAVIYHNCVGQSAGIILKSPGLFDLNLQVSSAQKLRVLYCVLRDLPCCVHKTWQCWPHLSRRPLSRKHRAGAFGLQHSTFLQSLLEKFCYFPIEKWQHLKDQPLVKKNLPFSLTLPTAFWASKSTEIWGSRDYCHRVLGMSQA